jgi:hypothetical protein
VQLGARDRAILRDVVCFGALTIEQIARRHFGAKITAYKRLERLADGGYVKLLRWWVRGAGVYVATPLGARAIGWPPTAARVEVGSLPHDLGVVDLAEWLLQRYAGATWRTERELRQEALEAVRGERRGWVLTGYGHVPDGALVRGKVRIAIELELTPKRSKRYEDILTGYASSLAYRQVWWFVGPEALRARIERLVEHLQLGDLVQVRGVPEAVHVARWFPPKGRTISDERVVKQSRRLAKPLAQPRNDIW